ncbi:MAG: hypothetical protein QF666_01160 [Alphaproteobacteria bacterium]|nr:hypothetical protein [Alphaproteobacteria bacterium]MDP6588035.1 hypothetical protein [Alphaproteobacteria bacterium]
MAGNYQLRLLCDRLEPGAQFEIGQARNRILYVARGSARVDGREQGLDTAWFTAGALCCQAGPDGAELWRWELCAGAGDGATGALISAPITTLEPGEGWLMRCDSVALPPEGCAYRHTHQGPGIRCLLEGGIRVETGGKAADYGPGEAWFEDGVTPVFAQAAAAAPMRFIRVMILPRALKGERSIRYVDDADRDKPKRQTYRIYIDEFVEL